MTSRAVPVDEVARAEAADVVTSAGDRRAVTVRMTLDDGSSIDLPDRLGTFLADLVESMAGGAGVSTSVLPEEMTTTVAADVIGVSRPTLVKMIDRGEIAARSVGTHRRLRREDVLAARVTRRDARRIAAQELLEAGEAFD
ncbi:MULTISPECIES: excisionase family DNA-binding protein [Curtobacterium]|jgi:excisionase family DNA binding protein|uniref:excisionase family DNA-binding protein n=1 Tax=Curtobacterium TaxID=2034 RepID=UPI0011A1F8E5|nr:excisionase family DNA-binding protein [Curtobacterium pusillum]